MWEVVRMKPARIMALVIALVAGGVIGLSFGMIQDLALRRHQKREQSGDLKSGWAVMPGSMRRVAPRIQLAENQRDDDADGRQQEHDAHRCQLTRSRVHLEPPAILPLLR